MWGLIEKTCTEVTQDVDNREYIFFYVNGTHPEGGEYILSLNNTQLVTYPLWVYVFLLTRGRTQRWICIYIYVHLCCKYVGTHDIYY